MPFAFALAALATILYVVPIFGTILSSVPIVLVALTAGGLSKAVLALGWILVIHALEAYVLNPKIMGDASKIHPVLIVLALVIGERTWGLVGALLAVPVASVVVAIFRFLHRKLGELDERAARPPAVRAPTPHERGASRAANERKLLMRKSLVVLVALALATSAHAQAGKAAAPEKKPAPAPAAEKKPGAPAPAAPPRRRRARRTPRRRSTRSASPSRTACRCSR